MTTETARCPVCLNVYNHAPDCTRMDWDLSIDWFQESQRLRSALVEVLRLSPDSPGAEYAKRVLMETQK